METGILYAVMTGLFWETSPVLVKRGLVNPDVSAATLTQKTTMVLTLILFTLMEGSVAAGQWLADLEYPTDQQFFSCARHP